MAGLSIGDWLTIMIFYCWKVVARKFRHQSIWAALFRYRTVATVADRYLSECCQNSYGGDRPRLQRPKGLIINIEQHAIGEGVLSEGSSKWGGWGTWTVSGMSMITAIASAYFAARSANEAELSRKISVSSTSANVIVYEPKIFEVEKNSFRLQLKLKNFGSRNALRVAGKVFILSSDKAAISATEPFEVFGKFPQSLERTMLSAPFNMIPSYVAACYVYKDELTGDSLKNIEIWELPPINTPGDPDAIMINYASEKIVVEVGKYVDC